MTSVVLLTNAPAPYTHSFMEAIRTRGADAPIIARYPAARIGRSWTVDDRDTIVTSSLPRDIATVAHVLRHRRRPDVVLTGSYTTPTDLVRRLLSTVHPTASVHFWGERLRPGPRRIELLRRCWFGAPGLDGVLAIGSRAAPGYRAVLGADRPVHVFPYTTSSGLAVPPEPSPRPTIGYAGRLLPYKGVDLVLEGLALLDTTSRPAFEIIGSGPDRPRLQRLAEHLGLGMCVRWLGELDQRQLEQRRRSWWMQAVPSRSSEGWGVVVNEALNSGVPVLASAHVNAAADLVRSGRNGGIVAAELTEHPPAWADAIASMCEPAMHGPCRVEARRVAEAFAPEHAARWLLDLLTHSGREASRSFVDETWTSLDG